MYRTPDLQHWHIFRMARASRPRVIPIIVCAVFLAIETFLLSIRNAVPLRHVIFVVLVTLYAAFANSFIRRTNHSQGLLPLPPRSLTPVRNSARLLFPFTFIFSLFVPIGLLITAGTSPIDGKPSRLYPILTPHLFLMIAQILVETVGFVLSNTYTLYVRFGLTIAFVVYRIPVAIEWYRHAEQYAHSGQGALLPAAVLPLTQAAAILNIVYWMFALLCFLLLYCLPAILREPQQLIARTSPSPQKPESRVSEELQ